MSRHRNHGKAARQPQSQQGTIPITGAANLEHLKGGNRQKQQAIANHMLVERGYVCGCGERMGDESIMAMGYTLGVFPRGVMTPGGPQVVIEDDAMMTTAMYHSKECPGYLDALANGLQAEEGQPRPKVRVIRHLPAVEWIRDAADPFLTATPDAVAPNMADVTEAEGAAE